MEKRIFLKALRGGDLDFSSQWKFQLSGCLQLLKLFGSFHILELTILKDSQRIRSCASRLHSSLLLPRIFLTSALGLFVPRKYFPEQISHDAECGQLRILFFLGGHHSMAQCPSQKFPYRVLQVREHTDALHIQAQILISEQKRFFLRAPSLFPQIPSSPNFLEKAKTNPAHFCQRAKFLLRQSRKSSVCLRDVSLFQGVFSREQKPFFPLQEMA